MVFYNRIFMAFGKEMERDWSRHQDNVSETCCFFVQETAIQTAKANLSLHCPLPAGVSSLISLLASAREEDQPRLSVLLCEAVVAVYLSLLIHGLGTHSSNELFRLAAHPLNNRMWAAVFGGGAKVIIKPKRPELPPGKFTVVYCFPSPALSPQLFCLHVWLWLLPSCAPSLHLVHLFSLASILAIYILWLFIFYKNKLVHLRWAGHGCSSVLCQCALWPVYPVAADFEAARPEESQETGRLEQSSLNPNPPPVLAVTQPPKRPPPPFSKGDVPAPKASCE